MQPVFIPETLEGVHLGNEPAITCPGMTPTCELVKELEKREAVQSIWIEPSAPFGISKFGEAVNLDIAEGAAKILVIWD